MTTRQVSALPPRFPATAFAWVIGLFVLFLIIIGTFKVMQILAGIEMGKKFAPPPEAVTTAIAVEEPWQDTCHAVGSFSPVRGVTVSAELGGKVEKIAFESGQEVQQGDLLVQVDVSVEQAEVKAIEARIDLWQLNFNRTRKLAEERAIAKSDLDEAESQLKQAKASCDALRATIERKTIRAPFTGRLGIRKVQLGQYLSPGDPVVILQTLDPIYVDFALPQQEYGRVQSGQKVLVEVDAFPGKSFEGTINAINPEVDDATRNVRIQATLNNVDDLLRPGMFGQVRVVVGKPEARLTLPATAINRAPYGDSVFIVERMTNAEGKPYLGVRQQFVKVGPNRGDQIAVLEGLQAGQEVVSSGLFKLRPNGEVQVNNKVIPHNSAAPKPQDS
jgi:membrane fusion protein (multidrug efflux system)